MPMATYHFSAHNGTDLPDLQVSELESLAEARREAVRVIYQLATVTTGDGDDWTVEVADDGGLTLFTATLNFIDAPVLGGVG
jgi:hypothetical protein